MTSLNIPNDSASPLLQGNQAKKSLWFWIFTGWCSLILIGSTQAYLQRTLMDAPWTWIEGWRYAMVEFIFWAIMTLLIARWAQRFPPDVGLLLRGTQRGKKVAILILLMLLTIVLHAGYRVSLHRFVFANLTPQPLRQMLRFYLIGYGLWDACVFWSVVSICQALRSAQRFQFQQQELAKAQLEVLKAQLQPHFLFNTLNSISWLMRKDVEAADNVISSLGDLLRNTLSFGAAQEVSLREELRILNLYFTIEGARFRDRLNVQIDVEPTALDCKVPGLLLQPIAENAVRHGVARLDGPGLVEIRGRILGTELCLDVLDNGPGISRDLGEVRGIGIANTRARLERHYGSAQSFSYQNRPTGGVSVEIRLPSRLPQPSTQRRCAQ